MKRLVSLLVFTATTLSSFAQDLQKIDLLTYGGLPAADSLNENLQILYNTAFITGYSNSLKNPVWTVYRYGNMKGKYDEQSPKNYTWERPFEFKTDQRTLAKVKHEDYNGSGFDRGHMAPNAGILEQYGQMAQLETFLMSNITPQRPELNQKIWAKLETEIREKIAEDDTQNKEVHDLYVISGPIFETNPPQRLPSGIAIPTSFFCIVAYHRGYGSTVKAIAFKFPQQPDPTKGFFDFVTTVDEVEALTKLNFFPTLSPQKQANLESKKRDFQLNDIP